MMPICLNKKLPILFIFIVLFAINSLADSYFWIGGTGNWSDINHWATTSGGSVLHLTPPSADDDVFFDANSFSTNGQIVHVNTENVVCRTLNWSAVTNSPVFENSSSLNIKIFGSLILSPDMLWNYDGTITFESTQEGNIILTEGQVILNNIIFDGINGGWTLMDDLTLEESIFLKHGKFNTNNYTVVCKNFFSVTSNNREMTLGQSKLHIEGSWTINSAGLNFNSDSSVIHVNHSLNNSGDTPLVYNNVVFTGGSSYMNNSGVYANYDSVVFKGTMGVMNGDCFVNYLVFFGSGLINDNDTIIQLNVVGPCYINGGHYIEELEAGDLCRIVGQNTVIKGYITGKGNILSENQIGHLFIGDIATIEGSNTFTYLYMSKAGFFDGTNYAIYAFFGNNGFFKGDNQFDSLLFSPGYEYNFEIESNQTVNNYWSLPGNCEFPIYMKSSYNGRKATIHSTNAAIAGTNLSLRDLHASGNTPFLAYQSVDLGNNANWVIDTMAIRDLYWVNGGGDWTNSYYWALSSGGVGGICPPTERDNVFFDQNSAGSNDTIVINIGNAVCHNMDWTGINQAFFAGPDTNKVKIYGSLTLSDNMNQIFTGEVHFEDTVGERTVFTAGLPFINNVRFQGNNGEWTLVDQFNCGSTIYHERGSISTNGSNIEASRYISADTNHRKLFLHADTVKLFADSCTWYLNGTNFSLHAESSVIETFAGYSEIISIGPDTLIYNNVHQNGVGSLVINQAYCVYNLVTHAAPYSMIAGDCTIDTSIMKGFESLIEGNNIIKTAIFEGSNSILRGNSFVEIAYFYESGMIEHSNWVDTALFFDSGIVFGFNEIDTTIIFKNALIEGNNVIRTANLRGNGVFNGNNIFQDLRLNHSKKYLFQHDSTQTITNNLTASGRCTGSIFLMSDSDGKQAIINKTNGPVEIEYANIRDIKADGNVPFLAFNSVDLGNNENWEITMGEPKALYWVGGTGNWSDSLHWAPVSGGLGPYCVPSPIDDVFFDENSFTSINDSVNIDLNNATCRNMNWSGSEAWYPILTGEDDNDLYIYGSLVFNETMTLDHIGLTFFESQEKGKTIETRGNSFINKIVFQGRGGGWSLVDQFSTADTIFFTHGTLNTNGQQVFCRDFISTDTNLRELLLDTSSLFIQFDWMLNAQNLALNANTSTLNVGSTLYSFNGDTLFYNNVIMNPQEGGILSIINDDVYCVFNNIYFMPSSSGLILGDCTIDSVIFETVWGVIQDSDIINFVWFKNIGHLSGGQHQVKEVYFDHTGTISGSCNINLAIFNYHGFIHGENIIDTTIILGSGTITGGNLFKSYVDIHGAGIIQGENVFERSVNIFQDGAFHGTNQVFENLVIHGHAHIFGNNVINDALLLDWGNLGGANLFDTLTFTPGKTYTLVNGQTQTINQQFNIRGNNCFPIVLQSSLTGSQANIFMNSDTVSGDFINMKDINAFGGAVFYAGGHSTNISNNSGWVWDDAPGYIYGLGFDSAFLCEGYVLVLSTENFNGGPNTIYQWGDGSIGPTYTVTAPGIYEVIVIYSDNCEVPGNVIVEQLPNPDVDLGGDREICEGTEISFLSSGNYTDYLWNTGANDPAIAVSETGYYWLEVTGANGCKNRDTVHLQVIPLPVVDLGPDQKIYNHEYLILDAGSPADAYLWSTGETAQTIYAYGVEGGNEYWVIVEYKGCMNSDTIMIDEYPSCIAELPTAFSPNGDLVNDVLEVFVSGLVVLDLKIFNRYGQLVFETSDPTGKEHWDGGYNNTQLGIEVFTFYLQAMCEDGFVIKRTGNITLIR